MNERLSNLNYTESVAGGNGGTVDEEGEVKARPVSVAHQTQCCGGLKSGVCNLL